jgi:glycosyltransferase involved in cell wall biosynthesis
VSVVIPNYNYAKTLRACLDSVFAQTLRPLEVILVDDASTDDSADIALATGATVLRQDRNRGVSAARNTGAAAASGDILFFLDSDVALAPDAISAAVAVLAAHPDCGCVYGVYDKHPLIDDGPIERYRTLHLHHALTRATGETSSAVFALAAVPRAVFTELGGFDEQLRAAEDDDYSERLLRRYRIRRTAAMVGRHDESDRLLPTLVEQFHRAQLMPFAVRNRLRRNALVLNRGSGLVAAGLAVLSVPLVLRWPTVALLTAALLVVFAVCDPSLIRFVRREKGLPFLAFFLGVHLLVNLALLAGALVGWSRATLDRSFGPSSRDADRRSEMA